MIQWLPWGRKKSFQEQAKKAYTFVIHTPYLHILIYTWYILPTFQPHTPPSYYITKLWIKHEKKIMVHQSCQRFSRLSDIMQFVNKPLPLISCTLAIQSSQCYVYIWIWIPNTCYLVCTHVCNLKVELLRLRQKIFLVLPTKTKCFDFLE